MKIAANLWALFDDSYTSIWLVCLFLFSHAGHLRLGINLSGENEKSAPDSFFVFNDLNIGNYILWFIHSLECLRISR